MLKNKTCRICGHNKFRKVIDFGKSPLVNSLLTKEELSLPEQTFPLVVKQCKNCFMVQIVDNIDSHKIYRDIDYLYFSSDMPGLSKYFQEYALDLRERFVRENDLVIEIGSNDGLMLDMMRGPAKLLGIDPSSNVVVRALSRGITTLSDFFSHRLSKSIAREFGKAKLIYGNNCIAHLDDIHDLMRGIKELLRDDGVFVVECNYWGAMVSNTNYSLIYHDHFSYFTVKDWIRIAELYNMKVFDAIVTPAQGGSLRVFLTNDLSKQSTQSLNTWLDNEERDKLASPKTCKRYSQNALTAASNLKKLLSIIKDSGKKIAGYGAAAKGLSALKLADIDGSLVDYFVDDSPAKQGKYTPVTHIPVISREQAQDRLPDYFFITAPNYEKVIIEKESLFKARGGQFITIDCRVI